MSRQSLSLNNSSGQLAQSQSILIPITRSRIKQKSMSRLYHEMLFNIHDDSEEKINDKKLTKSPSLMTSSLISQNRSFDSRNIAPRSASTAQRYEFTLDDFKISKGLQKSREILFQKIAISDQIVRKFDTLNKTKLQKKLQ